MKLIASMLGVFWRVVIKRRPALLNSIEPPFIFSKSQRAWNLDFAIGVGGWFPCSNHSTGYHGLLQQFWEAYGLGKKCLIVSETVEAARDFHRAIPETEFIATDYYLDLHESQKKTDLVWNLYDDPPAVVVSSVLCQATLEHLMDPVGVMRRFASIIEPGGMLYVHTQGPLFPYHPWPKDYLRFYPEWFTDLPQLINSIEVMEVVCVNNHAFAAYRKRSD